MPKVKMPNGDIVELPDNPTADQLKRLRSLRNQMMGPQPFPTPSAQEEALQAPIEDKILTGGGKMMGQAALPTAGMVGGSALGAMTGPAAPVAIPAMEAGGSMAGEWLNQKLGITQPSNLQIGLAGAAPLAGRMLPAALKFATKGRDTLNKVAAQEAENFIQRYLPNQSAQALFQQAESQGESIAMNKTAQTLDAMISKMQKASTPPAVMTRLENLSQKIAANGGALRPTDVQQEMEIVGKTVRTLESQEGSPFGAAKKVFEAMNADLDAAPAGQTLSLARQTFKRASVVDEMSDSISKATKLLRGQESAQFNANQVINDLNKNKFFKQSFNPQEQKEIMDLLGKLNKIPVLKPGAGVQIGSGRFWHGLGGLASPLGAGAAGELMGGPGGAAVGTMVGVAAPPVVETAKIISQTMHFPAGRALMKQLITQGDGKLSARGLAVLASFLRAQTAAPGSMMGGQPNAAQP